MKSIINPSIYSEAARSIAALRNLRKIKLFPRVSTVTVVTYFKDCSDDADCFVGKAFTLNLLRLKAYTVSLTHSSHSPPAVEDDEEGQEEEIELAPQPLPAIGCSALPAI